MKFFFTRILLLLVFSMAAYCCRAQNGFFADVPENSFKNPVQKRVIVPATYRTLQLDVTGLLNFLAAAPSEKNIINRDAGAVIEIPMPKGGSTRFKIWESSVMEPALAAKFPDIKTFTGQGIDDPTANIKLDITQFGFHAMIISSIGGAVFIDPYARDNTVDYISYNKTDFKKSAGFFEIPVKDLGGSDRSLSVNNVLAGTCGGAQLRTYRLALAATAEYTAVQGGTVAKALAAQVTTMNRVNGVYEREVAIRMILVGNNNLLIYTNAATDPYTNNNGPAMLNENQNNTTSVIGSNNYDIGHVFSTGGGGVAEFGVVCRADGKARGVTGSPNPDGDPFDIDYVAHEMGHQFGAAHTFNSVMVYCGGENGNLFSDAEPGSGSTIMAYAGICGSDDLQPHSDAQFHAISYNEITTFTMSGDGSGCAVLTNTGNTPPVVNAGSDHIIPKSTPFSLAGSATDADGGTLTYCWEQIDVGGPLGAWDDPSGNAPLFRSFLPISTPVRFFPKLTDVNSNTTTRGEILPAYGRTLHFRLTARDNQALGGGVCFDETAVTVNESTGPFLVTYPNTGGVTWLANDFKTVTWDPAGTAAAPVSCARVKIELSTNGGLTFPITLVNSTPNDGAEEIQVPNNLTSSARIRITSEGNVFYDISNNNFSIQNSTTAEFAFDNPLPVTACDAIRVATTLKTGALGGFSGAITLTAAGNPGGTTVTFDNNPLSAGGNTMVTFGKINTLASGTYAITINGVSGAVNKSRIITFVVNGIAAAPLSLTSPYNNSTGVSVLPLFKWAAVPGAGTYNLEISTAANFIPITQTQSNIASPSMVLTNPLAENTTYYWRVTTTNNCGTGPASASGIFKTGIKSSQLCPPNASTSFSSNLTGTTYQWQLNTGAGFGNIINNANYSGVNTKVLQINNAPSSWNGYQFRCVVDGANSAIFIIGFTSYWYGSVNNAWENPANWSCNAIPDANTDVVVNSGTVAVNSFAQCRSIKVNPASRVTVNTGFKITVTP